jgi:hypothetical protein
MLDKASELEEEYFKQKELELLKKFEKEREQYKSAEEKDKGKRLHYMKCPKCYSDLKEESFHGVNIDRCQQCHGVWLDAGELERLARHEESAVAQFFKSLRKRT